MLAAPVSAPRAEEVLIAVGEWPPFVGAQLPDNGRHAKLVRERLAAAGFVARFEFLPWSRSFNLTQVGRYAATFPWVRTEERAALFLISDRAVGTDATVGFYLGARFPAGVQAAPLHEMVAAGLRLAVLQDTWMANDLTKRGLPFQSVSRTEIGWNLIGHGRADVYIDNAEVGTVEGRLYLPSGGADLRITDPIRTDLLRILFSRVHPAGERLKAAWDAGP